MTANEQRSAPRQEADRLNNPPAASPHVLDFQRRASTASDVADGPVLDAQALHHMRNDRWQKVWVQCPHCHEVHTAEWVSQPFFQARKAPCGPGRYYRPVWPSDGDQ